MLNFKIKPQSPILKILLLTLASALMAFNLKAFIYNGDLVPGGFSGVAVLVQRVVATYCNGFHIPYSVIYLPLNALCFYIGFRYIGRKFTLYSLYVIVMSSILTDIMPAIPVTYDVLLIAIFGAIINGTAMSICLHCSACAGGTDFISIFLSERRGVDAWNYIFAGNVILLVIAGILFGFDKALYSIIYQFTQTQLLNAFNKRYQKHTLWIITTKPTEVCAMIKDKTHHSATIFKGMGSYRLQEQDVVYSIVGSDQAPMIVKSVLEIDEHAFINMQKTDAVGGNFYQRPTE